MAKKNQEPEPDYWGDGDARYATPVVRQDEVLDDIYVLKFVGPVVAGWCADEFGSAIDHANEHTPVLISLDCPGGDPAAVLKLIGALDAAIHREVPLAVHIEGRCFGAALFLALRAEMRFATRVAQFGRLLTWPLPWLLPHDGCFKLEEFAEQTSWDMTQHALYGMNKGGTVNAEYAEHLGIVTKLTPSIEASAELFRDSYRWK